jgi:hypothetical protein
MLVSFPSLKAEQRVGIQSDCVRLFISLHLNSHVVSCKAAVFLFIVSG